MESQMERMAIMWGKVFVLSLLSIMGGVNMIFARDSGDMSDRQEARVVAADNKSTNQVLMYRMLNNKTKDPSEINYYRRWKKERKLDWQNLTWLEDHRNLLDIMSDPDKRINQDSEWTTPGSLEDYRQDLAEDPEK